MRLFSRSLYYYYAAIAGTIYYLLVIESSRKIYLFIHLYLVQQGRVDASLVVILLNKGLTGRHQSGDVMRPDKSAKPLMPTLRDCLPDDCGFGLLQLFWRTGYRKSLATLTGCGT